MPCRVQHRLTQPLKKENAEHDHVRGSYRVGSEGKKGHMIWGQRYEYPVGYYRRRSLGLANILCISFIMISFTSLIAYRK